MSTNTPNSEPATPIREFPIPSMLTNSAVEMLDYFGDAIIEIEAQASMDTENIDELLRDYGLIWRQLQRQTVEFDYTQQRDLDGNPHNPLTEEAIEEVLTELRRRLNDPDAAVAPDMAVSRLVVRMEVPRLREVTRAQSDEFELTFSSDPVMGEAAREATAAANVENRLYRDLGFEYRNLNLRKVVETRVKYTQQGQAELMGWGGPGDTAGWCELPLARAVQETVLPEPYARLKFFHVDDANAVELAALETGNASEEAERDR